MDRRMCHYCCFFLVSQRNYKLRVDEMREIKILIRSNDLRLSARGTRLRSACMQGQLISLTGPYFQGPTASPVLTCAPSFQVQNSKPN